MYKYQCKIHWHWLGLFQMQVIKSHSSQLKQKTKLLAYPWEKNCQRERELQECMPQGFFSALPSLLDFAPDFCFFFRLPTDPSPQGKRYHCCKPPLGILDGERTAVPGRTPDWLCLSHMTTTDPNTIARMMEYTVWGMLKPASPPPHMSV